MSDPEMVKKSTYGRNQDGGRWPHTKRLNRYISAADCTILMKFGVIVSFSTWLGLYDKNETESRNEPSAAVSKKIVFRHILGI